MSFMHVIYVKLQTIEMVDDRSVNSLFGVLLLPLLPRLECQNCQKETGTDYCTAAGSCQLSDPQHKDSHIIHAKGGMF